jgi:hypothetical protein
VERLGASSTGERGSWLGYRGHGVRPSKPSIRSVIRLGEIPAVHEDLAEIDSDARRRRDRRVEIRAVAIEAGLAPRTHVAFCERFPGRNEAGAVANEVTVEGFARLAPTI